MMNELKWSKTEKFAAKRAFETAYDRECEAITAKLQEMIASVKDSADIWHIHDYLTEEREKTDHKYDYRYSILISVFAKLVKEEWLTEADLDGLQGDKIDKIKSLASQ
jgi:hypothetical protein